MILEDFFLRALIAGSAVAIIAAPLGCFVVWRRMAYFGDTVAHSALLGVALGFFFNLNLTVAVAAVTVAVALLLLVLQRRPWLSSDTLLGILSHGALSFGLVAIGLMAWLRLDLMSYLFGDILAVTVTDILWIGAGGVLVLGTLALIWRPLLAATVHEDLALAEGIKVARAELIFMLLIALTIALAMKLVGVLLITSLLIIPAAAARPFARSPEQMAATAALIGVASVWAGLFGSLRLDTPAGPSIVVAAAGFFLLGLKRAPFRERPPPSRA